MKKIFSLLLALTLLLGGSAFAAYVPQDVRDTEFENDVELMINLGFLDYTGEGMFKPYSHMTRSEFAQMLDGILDQQDFNGRASMIDSDENITYDEVIRTMIGILGYDAAAQNNIGYLSVARNIGMLDDVSFDGEYINKGNIARLIVNCFDINLLELNFENGRPTYSINGNKTMLSDIAGIYVVKDYVYANSNYGISSYLPTEGYLLIGDKVMLSPSEYADYVGYYVTCYYRENEFGEPEVVFINIDENRNAYLKVNAEDIDKIEMYRCTALVNDKEKTLKYDGETVFVYNGRPCKNFSSDMLSLENGWVEFIDNDSDNVYDLIKINEYYNMVVESLTQYKIYNKYDPSDAIDLENMNISIFDDSGNAITISDIASGDILSIFKSGDDDEDIVKLIRSRRTVSGTVEGITEGADGNYVTIAGEQYKIYNGYQTNTSTEIFLQDSGVFLLDAYDKVVSVQGLAVGVYIPAYAIEISAYNDDTTGYDTLRFRFLGENGVSYVYASTKVKIDGISYTSDDFINLGRSLQTSVGKVVLYKVNNSGNVIALDTTEQNSTNSNDDKLTTGPSVAESSSLRYKASTKVFEGKIAIDDNTKVFLVPSDITDAEDDEFAFRDATYFISDQSYKGLVTYRIDDTKIPVDYVVIQSTTSIINNESDVAVVKKITETVNDDGDVVNQIDVYANGADHSYKTASENVTNELKYITKYSRAGDTLVNFEGSAPVLGRGDIIKYSFNSNGDIDKIAVIYSASSKELYSVNPYHSDFHEQGQRYVMGTVNNKYEGYVELAVNSTTECHNIGSAKVFEVRPDVSREVMREISHSEIGVGDILIVITSAGAQRMTLVYR